MEGYAGFLVVIVVIIFGGVVSSMVKMSKDAAKQASLQRAKEVVREKAKDSYQKQLKQPKTVGAEKKHQHVSDLGNYELVPQYYEGGEGCDEHANIRYITPIVTNEEEEPDYSEIAKMLIIGEALSKPKYKYKHR